MSHRRLDRENRNLSPEVDRSGSGNTDPRPTTSHGTLESNEGGSDQPPQLHLETRKKLDNVVGEFRDRRMGQTKAIRQILTIVEECPDVSEEYRDRITRLFVNEIEATQSAFERAAGRASMFEGQPTGSEGRITGDGQLAPKSATEDRSKPKLKRSKGSRPLELPALHKSFGHDSSSSEDDGVRSKLLSSAPPSKRIKLRASDMPFGRKSTRPDVFDISKSRNPICIKNRELLTLYNRDLTGAKHLAQMSPDCPMGVPASQWDKILKGEAVDLDVFCSERHCVLPDSKYRPVKTHAEWVTAWSSASRATAHLFPHRKQELGRYGEYIDREFFARHVSTHNSIIALDRAIRFRVGGGAHLTLTDWNSFHDLLATSIA